MSAPPANSTPKPRHSGASWLPAALFVVVVAAFVVQGAVSGATGLAVGVAAMAGPLVLLLLQVRLAGSASQSPYLLGGLLVGAAVLGGAWAVLAGLLVNLPVVAAVAVVALPFLLAVLAVAILAKRGAVDEPGDLAAFCASVAFGWGAGFVAVAYGMSIRAGVLDHVTTGLLIAALVAEALLRPVLVTAAATVVTAYSTWRPRRGSALGLGVGVLVLCVAAVGPALLDQTNGLVLVAACGLGLGWYARWLIGRPDPEAPGPWADPDGPDSAAGTSQPAGPASLASQASGAAGVAAVAASAPDDPSGDEPSIQPAASREVPLGGVSRPAVWPPPPPPRSRDSSAPSPIALVAAVLALMGGLLFWGWWDGVRVSPKPCEPNCGVAHDPPKAPRDEHYAAADWRVLYPSSNSPSHADAHSVTWELQYQGYDGHSHTADVAFEDSRSAASVTELLAAVAVREAAGYRELYQIPNAGLGVYPGTGEVLERVQAPAGLPPKSTGFFILGVAQGDHAVVGWARGLREPGSQYNGTHFDPSFSGAAHALALLSSGFELLDKDGQPIYG